MARTRATAVSAIVLALGLTGAGIAPFIGPAASASVSAFDPPIEGCEAGEVCDASPDPETTVTVTTTLGTPTPDQPETTITKTVTASPTKTSAAPKPTKTTSSAAPTPSENQTTQNPAPPPTQDVQVPAITPTPSPETSIELPSPSVASDTPPPATTLPTDNTGAQSDTVPLELRNAAPEFDQRTLTQKLSIPALVLVLLALFSVLIFEGRLRRMAHAAAVRKAGPNAGRPGDVPPGYPAGPGYATASFPAPGYPGGTAYAPIISFVPVQTFPGGQAPPAYGPGGPGYQDPGYQDPGQPYPPQGYGPQGYDPHAYGPPVYPNEPHPDAVVLHPDEFDSYNHPPSASDEPYRDPFEPLIPPEQPPGDIPPGGAASRFERPERPFGPSPAAEPGDSEPWQHAGPPRDDDVTAVQPLPPMKETKETREMPDSAREPWKRSD
ncbi:hypothetical protein HII36_28700 [Nonomuraea sp. NN258]|uniref:hypothetical protein n=1 Tax=Nonomuraea antri TaxID=2730852 RepID=UPI001568AEED|nr:hypothetical protein [Nonomuraea antri]NRQ35784.1 hypothetical protein [Nonomuraea antri]